MIEWLITLLCQILVQLQRVENGLLHAVSAMGDEELLVLTKLLIEIEHFELVSLRMLLLVSCSCRVLRLSYCFLVSRKSRLGRSFIVLDLTTFAVVCAAGGGDDCGVGMGHAAHGGAGRGMERLLPGLSHPEPLRAEQHGFASTAGAGAGYRSGA